MPADEFELYLSLGVQRHQPDTLEIEMRRFPRKSVAAYWNGCPWVA